MIRVTIVELFKRDGVPRSLDRIASDIGMSPTDVAQRLAREDKLDDLRGLSLKQAFELLEFYGPNVLFTDAITENVQEAVRAKRKIARIEARKRGNSNSPPASNKDD
jgi:hypothetical protein